MEVVLLIGRNVINHINIHISNGVVELSGKPVNTPVLFFVDTPTLGLTKSGSPWGEIVVLYQPVTNLFEVHSIHFVELSDDAKQLVLVVRIRWSPQVR